MHVEGPTYPREDEQGIVPPQLGEAVPTPQTSGEEHTRERGQNPGGDVGLGKDSGLAVAGGSTV